MATVSRCATRVAAGFAPTVAQLAVLAGITTGVQRGDRFLSKGGRGRVCCVEYTAPPPDGRRIASIPKGTWLEAKEVEAVLIPADRKRRLPP